MTSVDPGMVETITAVDVEVVKVYDKRKRLHKVEVWANDHLLYIGEIDRDKYYCLEEKAVGVKVIDEQRI